MKVKSDFLEVTMLCLTFYELSILPHGIFLLFKYLVIVGLFIKYFKEIKETYNVTVPLAAYGLVILISSIVNKFPVNTIIAATVFVLQIVTIFFVTHKMIKKYGTNKFSAVLVRIFGCVIFMNDIMMIANRFVLSSSSEDYLVGGKFAVAYIHCFWMALIFLRNDTSDRLLVKNGKMSCWRLHDVCKDVLVIAFSLFVSSVAETATGKLSVITLGAFVFLPQKIQRKLSSANMIIISTGIANLLMFSANSILMGEHAQYFIQEILHKSSNLTGRSQIWAIIFELIRKKLWLGYGYYSGVINEILGYGNPQNAILKTLIDGGIIGLLAYIVFVFKALKPLNNSKNKNNFALVAFTYSMIVASLVEINLTHMIVFMAFAIIAFGSENEKNNTSKESIKLTNND